MQYDNCYEAGMCEELLYKETYRSEFLMCFGKSEKAP